MFDSYNVKKILPRLFVAVILIQLSWFLFTGMIVLTNAIAYGIEGLIYAPFGGAKNMGTEQILSMSTGGSQLGAFAAIAAGVTAVGAALAVGGVLATAGMVLLGVLIALALLAFRQVMIVALLLISPLAIVAWILPGTEKWWKMWWESFSKLLLLYPIIIGFLATGRALAYIVQKADPDTGATGALDAVLKFILVIICIFGPFYLIPKTFQLAGGVFQTLTGTINNTSKGAFDRLRNRRKQTMATKGERTGRRILQRRSDMYNRMMNNAANSGDGKMGTFRRTALRGAARTVGGYNIEAAASAKRAQVGKELNEQIATGRDEEIRALTVNKKHAINEGTYGEDWRNITDANGKVTGREFKTLGGQWVNEAYVDAAHQRWGRDTFAQQAALSYEMRKANSEEDVQRIADNYGAVAKGWGNSEAQAKGNWVGAAYENQGTHLEFKHMSMGDGFGAMSLTEEGSGKLAEEMHEKRGNYQASQMHAHTFKTLTTRAASLSKAVAEGTATEAQKTELNRLKGVAETFIQRSPYGRASGGGEGDDQAAIHASIQAQIQASSTELSGGALSPQQGSHVTPTVYASGAGHTNENIREFAQATGILRGDIPHGAPSDGSLSDAVDGFKHQN